MKSFFRFIILALVVLVVEQTQARRHHVVRRAEVTSHEDLPTEEHYNSTLLARQNGGGVLRMGQSGFVDLATSYIVEDSSSNAGSSNTPASNLLGGACGWAGMPKNGAVVWGAAIQTKYFGKGLSCGMCVLIKQDGTPQPARQGGASSQRSIKVAIVDECPNTPGDCKSIDMQLDGMLAFQGQPRVGQMPIVPTVVPCNYKAAGIHIQVKQITASPYDFRIGLRGNSGAIAKAYVRGPRKELIELVKSESNQYTLPDQSMAKVILGGPTFSLDLVSNEGERLYLPKIKHNIGTSSFGQWQDTANNFEKS
ncbi:hypothetical protein CBS101457_002857 [Exobasidium rhododendri]|nr:hypothetical protein CBS101457_002857 [Exobasidium rhododendri]